jgi:hypothetical protein
MMDLHCDTLMLLDIVSPKKATAGYATSWMVESVQASLEDEHQMGDPRAELRQYLDSPAVAIDDIVAWWGVNKQDICCQA